MNKITLLLILGIFSFTNCKKSKNDINNLDIKTKIDSSKMHEYDPSNLESIIYDIKGETIFLRDGPGDNFKKLVNQKATAVMGETQYMQVDYTCTVSIVEEKNNWAKVKVVEPSHLSASHYGWIPLRNIIKDSSQIFTVDISKLKYEVISTTENNVSKNYNIYLDIQHLSKNEISNFVKQFRDNNCSTCTISIFDTKSIRDLIDVYPLNKNQYLKFADHFVAWSTFDAPKMVSFYPFQDSKYKEYGGKNYKEQKMQ